ncbi:NADPH-dependent FMN reductase [Longispora albida]|uniref:NADPH-dependent FMN reductase n=1 Tax=Longispora albida TaxID=203523 RepID=UPI000369DC8C|nr:NAD(P)H-dependent oxidoreductase [Longispora albida]
MSSTALRLAVIIASTRAGRRGPMVTSWFAGQAGEYGGFDIDVIDLAEHPLPLDLTDDLDEGPAAVLAEVSGRLDKADAFVIVTPEYNHSFTAPLKNVIDWHKGEWKAKPIGFVAYGGTSGGLRAVEQLRLVFAELHAVTVRTSVAFPQVWEQFDSQGQPVDPAMFADHAKNMLSQLTWWGEALREARTTKPYFG